MASRSEIETIVREVLSESARHHKDADRRYLVCIGASVSDGPIHYAQVEITDARVPDRAKPALSELFRTERSSKQFESSLALRGRYENQIRQQPMASQLPEFLRDSTFHCVANSKSYGAAFKVHVWCVAVGSPSTAFGPLLLRSSIDWIVGALAAKSLPANRNTFNLAVRGGAVKEALEQICSIFDVPSSALWTYSAQDRNFRALATAGIAKQPLAVPVSSEISSGTRRGIVSQITPERRAVVFDTKDRSAWRPPHEGQWDPFDSGLFGSHEWRSCIAIPIVLAGRLLGALTIYSPRAANDLRPDLVDVSDYAYLFAETLLTDREQTIIRDLANRYESELLRSNISLSALSLTHDVFHYFKGIRTSLDEAELFVTNRNFDELSERLANAQLTIARVQPVVTAMRELASEARETTDAPKTCDPLVVLRKTLSLLQSVIPTFSTSIEPDDVTLVVEGTNKCEVPLSPIDLERIVLNLCVNSAQWKATKIEITARISKKFSLIVRDDGIGIKKEDRDRVFDRFFTNRKTGSGLGLYVVRTLAARVGGDTHLQSVHLSEKAGYHGTVVSITLPRSLRLEGSR